MASDAQPPTTANYQSLKDSGLPFIVPTARAGEWYFAATLKPLTQPA